PGARAGAHPPSRLPRQPAADARRDAVVLSPRGVVAVAADSSGAGELLRRSGGEPLRRSVHVREGAGRSRGAARRRRTAGLPRAGRHRRIARPAREASHRRPVACRARPGLAGSATILVMLAIAAGAAGTDAPQSSQPTTSAQAASAPPEAASRTEPLTPREVIAATRAIEASARTMAKEFKDSLDSLVPGSQRHETRATTMAREQELAVAVADVRAAAAAQDRALEEQMRQMAEHARAMVEHAQTPPIAVLADMNRTLLSVEAASTVALVAHADTVFAAATAGLTAQLNELSAAAATLAPAAA